MIEPVEPSHAARWQVVKLLYSLTERLPEGSESADVVEHAISLTLNPQRVNQDVPLLLYDVLRNAQHSVRRTSKRREALRQKLKKVITRDLGMIDYATPETIFLAREFIAQLYKSIAHLGPHATRCLEGMLVGESIEETATACGLSRSSIDRIRRQIRIVARSLSEED